MTTHDLPAAVGGVASSPSVATPGQEVCGYVAEGASPRVRSRLGLVGPVWSPLLDADLLLEECPPFRLPRGVVGAGCGLAFVPGRSFPGTGEALARGRLAARRCSPSWSAPRAGRSQRRCSTVSAASGWPSRSRRDGASRARSRPVGPQARSATATHRGGPARKPGVGRHGSEHAAGSGWLTLAAILDWVGYRDGGAGYVSHLPVNVAVRDAGGRDASRSVARRLRDELEAYASVSTAARTIVLQDVQAAEWWLGLCGGEVPASMVSGYLRSQPAMAGRPGA